MLDFKRLEKHANLVTRMSDTLGLDIAEELRDGNISANQLRDRVLRCTHCEKPDECEQWLSGHAEGADAAPGYCRNKAQFDMLLDGKTG